MLSIFFMSTSTFAQQTKEQTQVKSTQQKKSMDCCLMKNGKIYELKNGKETLIEKEMTLKNGTVVSPDGTCKMKEGKTMKMKEGQCCDMNGKIRLHADHIKKP